MPEKDFERFFGKYEIISNTFSAKSPEWEGGFVPMEDLTAEELKELEQNIKQIKNKNK